MSAPSMPADAPVVRARTEPEDPTLALAAFGFDEDERTAIRLATMPNGLVPMERLELLHFLDYPGDLPHSTTARVVAVVERILRNRGYGG